MKALNRLFQKDERQKPNPQSDHLDMVTFQNPAPNDQLRQSKRAEKHCHLGYQEDTSESAASSSAQAIFKIKATPTMGGISPQKTRKLPASQDESGNTILFSSSKRVGLEGAAAVIEKTKKSQQSPDFTQQRHVEDPFSSPKLPSSSVRLQIQVVNQEEEERTISKMNRSFLRELRRRSEGAGTSSRGRRGSNRSGRSSNNQPSSSSSSSSSSGGSNRTPKSALSATRNGGLSKGRIRRQSLKRKESFDSLSIESDELLNQMKNPVNETSSYRKFAEHQKFERIRKLFTIPTTSLVYQVWKILIILLCFCSSFQYSYYATFRNQLSEDQADFFRILDIFYSSIFTMDLIISILTDEHNFETEGPWSLRYSCLKQMRGHFIFDLIALIPLPQMIEGLITQRNSDLLYHIKIVRLVHGFKLLHYQQYKKQLKDLQHKRILKIIRQKKYAEDQDQDSAKMSQIMFFTQLLKTGRLIVILLCLSFFTGLFWINFSNAWLSNNIADQQQNFLVEYNFFERSNENSMIASTYFTFTTLSTVGLGDYHPKSNNERIACAMVMMFGVMITSFLMDNLSAMIKELRDFDKNYDQSEELALFLGTLRRFNGNVDLPSDLVVSFERFFLYRWNKDKNLAVSQEADIQLLEQLPRKTRTQIFVDFLFKNFQETYKPFLELKQNQAGLRRKKLLTKFTLNSIDTQRMKGDTSKFYSSDQYEDFITTLLGYLEPLQLEESQIILKDGVSVNQVLFLMSGDLEIGYNHKDFVYYNSLQILTQQQEKQQQIEAMKKDEAAPSEGAKQLKKLFAKGLMAKFEQIAKKQAPKYHYPMLFKPGQVVGIFEVLFNQPSKYIYRIYKEKKWSQPQRVNGLFIRQSNLQRLMWMDQSDKGMTQMLFEFKNNSLMNFVEKIYFPIQEYQSHQLELERRRAGNEFNKQQMSSNLVRLFFGKKKTGGGLTTKDSTKKESSFAPVDDSDESSSDRSATDLDWDNDDLTQGDVVERVMKNELKKDNWVLTKLGILRQQQQKQASEQINFNELMSKSEKKLEVQSRFIVQIINKFQDVVNKYQRERQTRIDEMMELEEEIEAEKDRLADLKRAYDRERAESEAEAKAERESLLSMVRQERDQANAALKLAQAEKDKMSILLQKERERYDELHTSYDQSELELLTLQNLIFKQMDEGSKEQAMKILHQPSGRKGSSSMVRNASTGSGKNGIREKLKSNIQSQKNKQLGLPKNSDRQKLVKLLSSESAGQSVGTADFKRITTRGTEPDTSEFSSMTIKGLGRIGQQSTMTEALEAEVIGIKDKKTKTIKDKPKEALSSIPSASFHSSESLERQTSRFGAVSKHSKSSRSSSQKQVHQDYTMRILKYGGADMPSQFGKNTTTFPVEEVDSETPSQDPSPQAHHRAQDVQDVQDLGSVQDVQAVKAVERAEALSSKPEEKVVQDIGLEAPEEEEPLDTSLLSHPPRLTTDSVSATDGISQSNYAALLKSQKRVIEVEESNSPLKSMRAQPQMTFAKNSRHPKPYQPPAPSGMAQAGMLSPIVVHRADITSSKGKQPFTKQRTLMKKKQNQKDRIPTRARNSSLKNVNLHLSKEFSPLVRPKEEVPSPQFSRFSRKEDTIHEELSQFEKQSSFGAPASHTNPFSVISPTCKEGEQSSIQEEIEVSYKGPKSPISDELHIDEEIYPQSSSLQQSIQTHNSYLKSPVPTSVPHI